MKRNKGFSPMLLILIVAVIGIVAVVVFGIFGVAKIGKQEVTTGVETKTDEQVSQLNTLNTSDEVSVIESDLNSTNLEDLDQDMDQVEKDLNSER